MIGLGKKGEERSGGKCRVVFLLLFVAGVFVAGVFFCCCFSFLTLFLVLLIFL